MRPDPNNPARFIRSPFPNNIIPTNRIVNPLYNLYRQMVPPPNQNLIANGATPTGNYYRGGEPDKPVSSLYAGRVDYNLSGNDRFFFRFSGNTFIEPVSDWTYEVPEFEGLHSIDRSRYNWAFVGNWTHVAGKTLIDTQVASNRFWQDDKLLRLHDYKPTDMGLPAYLDAFCQAQNDCMLPAVGIAGYQGISQGAASGDTTTNLQGTVNVTQIRGAHTLRGGVDARLAQRQRGPGGNPSGQLTFTNEFTRQASDTSQLTPSNLGLSLAAFMLGIPSTSSATIQPTVNLRNHFFAAYAQDTWRLNNLTVNFGLRFEWENGISEDDGALVVDFDPSARLAISDLAEAAYARAPIPQLAPADFHVRGGSLYATDPGQDGTVWRPQALWMPRVSASYRLGGKTVVKAGYGLYYDTLNAADFNQNNPGFSSTTTNTNSTNFGQTFLLGNPYAGELGISDPFPVRADGTRFDEPTGSSLGVNTIAGSAYTIQNQNHEHARQQRWRIAVQRELARNLSVEVAYDGAYSDRLERSIREDYLPRQYWIPGSLNARDAAAQGVLTANVTSPYTIANFAPLRAIDPVLYQRMAANGFFTATTVQRNRLLRPHSHINNLTYSNLPLGAVEVHSLQFLVNRRFTGGFTANAAMSFNSSRANRTVEEFDREPTLWWDDNNSRPFRISGGAVYELPFGTGKPLLNEGGFLAAVAGGWQTGGTFEYQPGSIINFNTNLFYYGRDVNDIKKSNPEIALNPDGTLDATKYWFNVENFERDPTRTPTSFQTRAFPFQIDGLRGPGLTYVNVNVVRNFRMGARSTFQARFDIQNLLNYAAYNNPITDPTNSNFGKVTTAVASAGAMRFFNFVVRFTF